MLTSIITGDIIKSRKSDVSEWLPLLERALKRYAVRGKRWEVFRGDSFQVEVDINQTFEAFIYIKTALKTVRPLDVRMSIGIGTKSFQGKTISKSNGEVFLFSGEAFEELKKQNAAIKTPWKETTEELNFVLGLMVFIVEKWNVNQSKTIKCVFENKEITQQKLSELLHKNQGQISRELKKAGYEDIQRAILFCTEKIRSKC